MTILQNAVPLPMLRQQLGLDWNALYRDLYSGRIAGVSKVRSRYYVDREAAKAYARQVRQTQKVGA